MARPTKAKDAKGADVEVDETGAVVGAPATQAGFDIKFIVTILVVLIAGFGGSVASVMFIAPSVIVPKVVEQVIAATGAEHAENGEGHGDEDEHGGHGGHGGGHQPIGMILPMDEFTVNLRTDPTLGGNQFLRTKMSLSIQVPEEEYCDPTGGEHHAMVPTQPLQEGSILGAASPLEQEEPVYLANGGGAVDPYIACKSAFDKSMGRFIPTERDIINQALMKRTAGTLATVEGQEFLKDEIKTQINQVIGPKYSVQRVNFSDFIIQY